MNFTLQKCSSLRLLKTMMNRIHAPLRSFCMVIKVSIFFWIWNKFYKITDNWLIIMKNYWLFSDGTTNGTTDGTDGIPTTAILLARSHAPTKILRRPTPGHETRRCTPLGPTRPKAHATQLWWRTPNGPWWSKVIFRFSMQNFKFCPIQLFFWNFYVKF